MAQWALPEPVDIMGHTRRTIERTLDSTISALENTLAERPDADPIAILREIKDFSMKTFDETLAERRG